MKDLVKYVKMMRYALQFKMILVLAIIFFVFGILFEVVGFSDSGSSYSLAALYLALTGMYFYQLVFSTTVSKMVQASPMKKKLQVTGPVLITFITSFIVFAIYVAIRLIKVTPEFLADNNITYPRAYSTIPFMAGWLFIFFIYMAFSYRAYILSIIFIAVTVIGILGFSSKTEIFIRLSENLIGADNSPLILILVSLAIMILGAIIGYILSLLLYKKPISDMAVRYALRQASK